MVNPLHRRTTHSIVMFEIFKGMVAAAIRGSLQEFELNLKRHPFLYFMTYPGNNKKSFSKLLKVATFR